MSNKLNSNRLNPEKSEDIAFSFNQFLPLAEEILETDQLKNEYISWEAIYRDIIFLAYGAAYNHAHEWLEVRYNLKTRVYDPEKEKIVNRDGLSAHVLTYTDLYALSKQIPKQKILFENLSELLETLFEKRNQAYYTYEEITLKDVKDTITNARKVIENLKW